MELASQKDLKFLGGALIVMVLINFAMMNFQNYFTKDFIVSYTVFVLLYAVFVLWFIFNQTPQNTETGKYVKTLVAWVLVFMSLSLIIYPMVVTQDGIPDGVPTSAKISSDVYIYTLLPPVLPSIVRYYVTYVVAPALFLFVAYKLLAKQEEKFAKFVKNNM